MTIVHMVMFKFRPEVTAEHRATFVRELKKLKYLPCVKDGRLVVGGPSVTDPIERSKGFHYALVSFHQDRKALDEYQASKEHHWVTSTYMFPFKEDLVRFDFEIAPEDEYLVDFTAAVRGANGLRTPVHEEESSSETTASEVTRNRTGKDVELGAQKQGRGLRSFVNSAFRSRSGS